VAGEGFCRDEGLAGLYVAAKRRHGLQVVLFPKGWLIP
jgi:hypothetical protein